MQAGFRIDSKPETLLALDRRGLLAGASEGVEVTLPASGSCKAISMQWKMPCPRTGIMKLRA
ncbi:MAG: hypothetical protein IJS08_03460 [Victivallales bacterium]|nr:hypothetical protein [Victivallales bacterium]